MTNAVVHGEGKVTLRASLDEDRIQNATQRAADHTSSRSMPGAHVQIHPPRQRSRLSTRERSSADPRRPLRRALIIQNFTDCGPVQGPAIRVPLDNDAEDVSPPA
ncbi:MAG: hypothetical protein ACXVXL_29040 [Solirubrobacteraceae bacterium]